MCMQPRPRAESLRDSWKKWRIGARALRKNFAYNRTHVYIIRYNGLEHRTASTLTIQTVAEFGKKVLLWSPLHEPVATNLTCNKPDPKKPNHPLPNAGLLQEASHGANLR